VHADNFALTEHDQCRYLSEMNETPVVGYGNSGVRIENMAVMECNC
jgi:hypothetical protein